MAARPTRQTTLSSTNRPPRLIEIRLVDRETARKDMAAGLIAAGIATGVFALAFIVALFYIAQG